MANKRTAVMRKYTQKTKHNTNKLATVLLKQATFVAVVEPETRISFLLARCRYLSIFRILLVTNYIPGIGHWK